MNKRQLRHVWKLAVDYILYAPNCIIFNLDFKKFLTSEGGTAPFPNPSPRRTVATNFGRAPLSEFLDPPLDTQSSPLLRSTCPNHLNLPRLTTSATLWTLKRLYKSTLRFLSFSDTPHIHLTIIRFILSRLCRFAIFIAQVSVPYVNTLWTQALYIFPFMWYDAPRAVRIGDNSLNLAQAQVCYNYRLMVMRWTSKKRITK